MDARHDKGYRGDAAQFFVAAELCRRELVAVVTLGNCPNTDILVSNAAGTRFCHVQVIETTGSTLKLRGQRFIL